MAVGHKKGSGQSVFDCNSVKKLIDFSSFALL